MKNLWEAVYDPSSGEGRPGFEQFITVCKMAGEKNLEILQKVLREGKNITAFVPTNEAFNEFLSAVKNVKLSPDIVFTVVAYHVVKGLFCRENLKATMNNPVPMFLDTFSNTKQKLSVGAWKDDGVVHIMLDNAEIQGKAINLGSQTAFRIDSVLLPPLDGVNVMKDPNMSDCGMDDMIPAMTHKQKKMKMMMMK